MRNFKFHQIRFTQFPWEPVIKISRDANPIKLTSLKSFCLLTLSKMKKQQFRNLMCHSFPEQTEKLNGKRVEKLFLQS